MGKGRIPTWLKLLLAAAGLLLVIPALWVFVSLTATPMFPNPERVPTTMLSPPLPKWAGAVEQGRRSVRASVAEQNLPGLSVAVGVDGDIVWAEGFGYADLWTSTPVTPDHRFRIGTASTALTSAAVGLLLENGALELDDEIQTYVPQFPKKQWPVSLRQLMGHTAGLIPDDGGRGPLITEHCQQPAEGLKYFAGDPLLFKPGTEYRYSGYGWILVSAAVEAAAKQPLLTFMRERIFDPLGMRETTSDQGPDPEAREGEDFPPFILIRELIHDPEATLDSARDSREKPAGGPVTPYFPRFASDPKRGIHVMRLLDYSCYAGASAIVSTPTDLVRFGMAVQSGKLLKPATVESLQTPQRLDSGAQTWCGLGWRLKAVTLAGRQTRVIGQDGDSLGGMVASLMTFPEYGLAVAVTSNIPYSDTSAIGLKVAEAFAGEGRIPARK